MAASPSAVIREPKKIKSATVSTFSPSICHEAMGLDAMILHNLCMCMRVYVCVYTVVWCMYTYIFVSQGSMFFHWHLVQLLQIFVWKNIFSTFSFFQNIFFFWKKMLFVIIRSMLLNPLTPCLVFLWPSVKCVKPGNYRKEWKRTKKALAVSLPTDAPSTLLTSSSHFPFTTEVWSPRPRRPWGSALVCVCVCVCVCVFSKPEASVFSLPSDPAVEQTPQHKVCLLPVLLIRLHKDRLTHRWRVSTAHLIPGCTTQAQALNGVVLAQGTDRWQRIQTRGRCWLVFWQSEHGILMREDTEVFSICGSTGHSNGKVSLNLPHNVDTTKAGWQQAKWKRWNINLWKDNFPFPPAHRHEPGIR